MALLRYTALRFFVFVVVAALLWIFGMRGFWLLLVAIMVSGFASLFILNRSRDELSRAYVERRQKIKQRLADRTAAEDAWNDDVRDDAS
ncbi:MAG TPA: DUF4229 domain-containing protein [Jiangellaceae bacterium]